MKRMSIERIDKIMVKKGYMTELRDLDNYEWEIENNDEFDLTYFNSEDGGEMGSVNCKIVKRNMNNLKRTMVIAEFNF